jgi:uncharacterized Zn-binding protein involved in type VI secretion
MAGVARFRDAVYTGHGCDVTTSILTSSFNVFINQRGAARLGDLLAPHTILVGKFCVGHTAFVMKGSRNVFVNGRPLSSIGDAADAGVIITGSLNTFVNGLL